MRRRERVHECGGSKRGECRDCPEGFWAEVSDFVFGVVIDCELECSGCSGCSWRGCSGCSGCLECELRQMCTDCKACPKGQFRAGCGRGSQGFCSHVGIGEYKDVVGAWTTKPKKCQPCDPGMERVGVVAALRANANLVQRNILSPPGARGIPSASQQPSART